MLDLPKSFKELTQSISVCFMPLSDIGDTVIMVMVLENCTPACNKPTSMLCGR